MAQRVCIDALAARLGGTAIASVQLARQLALRPEVSDVLVLTRRDSIVAGMLTGDSTVRCIVLEPRRRFELLRRLVWQAARMPGVLEREGCEVLVSMSGILPRKLPCRVMCLLGNSLMFERVTPANVVRRLALRRTARQSEYLAAPSRAMAKLVRASTGCPCDVVALGVDHATFSPSAEKGSEILCVADFYPHKRHDLLLAAWELLPVPRTRLRLIGDPRANPGVYQALLAQIRGISEAEAIVLEHDLPPERIADACRRARVFVMPSEHESFCMPLLESMACGVPAVVRDHAGMRETAGVSAKYVSGDAAPRWSDAIRTLLEDDQVHDTARREALRAARVFSWEALAGRFAQQIARESA